jgi:hypothetical protein
MPALIDTHITIVLRYFRILNDVLVTLAPTPPFPSRRHRLASLFHNTTVALLTNISSRARRSTRHRAVYDDTQEATEAGHDLYQDVRRARQAGDRRDTIIARATDGY